MYTVEVPNLRKDQLAVILHYPESVGHYYAGARCVIVKSSGDWIDRAETKLGSRVRLYDDGTAFIGLGSYGRPIHGTWESFTREQLANSEELVRTAPIS
ncbi:MAG TPA: hypothetical protein VFH87_01675 [Candidatus Udaeobacter sp.]|nr:hypothetical protein [Candidatus Udaeobacter sp.]